MTMNESRFIELQHQMRENQTELQDFLKDLDSWESDIKKKDIRLQTSKSNETKDLPPIRNSLDKKKKKKTKLKEANKEKPKRITSYDYRSWDKFDVERACDSSEDEGSSDYETDEEWECLRRKQQAEHWKDQGNQYLKEKRYNEAIECYTKGIDCDSSNCILPANRAMALIKQHKYAAAELDCSASLAVDSTYVKAYLRRGTCRIELKKYEEAKLDFIQALSIEPNNKQAKAEIVNIEKLLHPPMLHKLDTDVGIVKPIHKTPEQRSKKPVKRIQVEEIGKEGHSERAAEIDRLKSSQSKTSKQLMEKENEAFNKYTKPSDILQNPTTALVEDEGNSTNASLEAKCGIQPYKEDTPVTLSAPTISGVNGSSLHSPQVPDTPTSSFQFQASWKVVKDDSDLFYQFFKKIEPISYKKLLGEYLDSDVLNLIFLTLKKFYIPNKEDILPVLLSLVEVKRFDMIVMFMSSKEKEVVKDLFSHVNQLPAAASLASKYGL